MHHLGEHIQATYAELLHCEWKFKAIRVDSHGFEVISL